MRRRASEGYGSAAMQARCGDRLVVLTHYPPRFVGLFPGDDAADAMVYESVAALVTALRPVLVVTGHEHRWAGLSATLRHKGGGTTLIVNPGAAGAVVEIGERRARVAQRGSHARP